MSPRKQLCVYTHSANGKVFYVGQGTRFRPKDRNNRSRAWKAHAESGYDVNIARRTDDRGEAVRVESELIAAHPATCNIKKYDRRGYPESVAIAKVEIRLSPSQVAEVDEWRRHQPDNPPRATAVVRLFAMALEAEEKKAARVKK